MKPSTSSIIKITLFLLLGFVFGSSFVLYSNSRGNAHQIHRESDENDPYNSGDDRNRRYEKQFIVNDGGTLVVEADAGTVVIKSWDKKEVSIVVEIEGTDSRVEKYRVEFKQEGDKVSVVGKVRDKSFFKWHVGNLEAHYTIFTPKKFSADVNTSDGNIETSDLIGKISLNTSGGNVNVENIEGKTIASTSGGDVGARDIQGELEVETSGGSVRCTNVTGDVYGHTSGGNVEIANVDGRVKASTSGGNIVIKVTGENRGIDAETSGGDIDIFVKENIAANIDAETSGGSVDCDLPVTVKGKVKDNELHGKINDGGNPIRAETSGGSIRIAVLK